MNGSDGWHFTFLGYPAGFGQPEALWLCLGMAVLGAAAVLLALWHRDRLAQWLHPKLAPRLAPGRSRWRPVGKAALSGAGLVLLAFALARPQLGGREELLHRRGIDVVVALDDSLSMLAQDVAPDRLSRAKLELETLLDQLQGDRVGLVTFAGDSFIQMPLTSDYAAARMFLRAVDPTQMQQGGTDIGGALRRARQVLDNAEHGAKERVVVLLSDGEDWGGDALDAARELREAGIRLFTVGIGSEAGAPIPLPDGHGGTRGYKKDAQGQPVLTRLDLKGLETLAREGGGEAFYQPRAVAMGEVAHRIEAMQKSDLEDHRILSYTERYQWFAFPGLLLLLAGALLRPSRAIRREVPPTPPARRPRGRRVLQRAPGGLAAALLLCLAGRAHASGLLEKPEALTERGRQAYEQGRYEEALKSFDEAAKRLPPGPALEFNRGSALYKLGRTEEAKQAFLRAAQGAPGELEEKDRYNLGNALAQLGAKKEAIAEYRRALALNPDDERARHNLEVLLQQDAEPKQEQQDQRQAQNPQGKDPQQAQNQQGKDQGQQQQAQNQQGKDQGQQQAQNQQGQQDKDQGQQQAQNQQGQQGKDQGQQQQAQSQQAKDQGQQQQAQNQQGQGSGDEDRSAQARAEAPQGVGRVAPLSPGSARVLDSMRASERSLQAWRFQQKPPRRNDENEHDW